MVAQVREQPLERKGQSMRFGFVGLGFATTWLHLPAVRALPDAQIVGGVDTSPERRAEWTALEAGPLFDDVEALLATRPDVVVVATPPDSHARLCIAALEAGANVVCEKPFVETPGQAEEVLGVARRVGRQVAVNHEFRFMPIFAGIPPQIGRADVGRVVFVHCTQFMDLPPWKEKVEWRAAMADRALFEGGVHIVDLLHLVVGRLPRAVFAMTSSGNDERRLADAVHLVTLDYGGGLLAQVTINRLCRAGTRYVDLRVDCEQASIRASMGGRAFLRIGAKRAERPGIRLDYGPGGLAWAERGLGRRVIARNARDATVKATQALYASTVAAWRQGREPATAAEISRDSLLVIDAAYRSARSGQRVELASA